MISIGDIVRRSTGGPLGTVREVHENTATVAWEGAGTGSATFGELAIVVPVVRGW